jgi:leader peptidase (prepilin peptidase) / N-methyltransferase
LGETETVTVTLLAFLFGLLIGSFLNVCIHRWPRNRSVIRPRSHCVRCRNTIAFYDNIPLVSYAILGGKCRHCGRRISLRYPAVELLTGLLFALVLYRFGPTAAAAKIGVFCTLSMALVFCDFEKRILPDQFTVGGAVLGLVFSLFVYVPHDIAQLIVWILGFNWSEAVISLGDSLAGAALPAGFMWLGGAAYEHLRKREGLGFGDVKLTAMIGAFLGMRATLAVLILGSVAGSIIGYGYIWIARKDASTYELPFGTFLGAAAIFVALFGPRLLTIMP